jgi:DNA modification methylase
MEELALHPTVKPVKMNTVAIKDVSGRGNIVLQVFKQGGSEFG